MSSEFHWKSTIDSIIQRTQANLSSQPPQPRFAATPSKDTYTSKRWGDLDTSTYQNTSSFPAHQPVVVTTVQASSLEVEELRTVVRELSLSFQRLGEWSRTQLEARSDATDRAASALRAELAVQFAALEDRIGVRAEPLMEIKAEVVDERRARLALENRLTQVHEGLVKAMAVVQAGGESVRPVEEEMARLRARVEEDRAEVAAARARADRACANAQAAEDGARQARLDLATLHAEVSALHDKLRVVTEQTTANAAALARGGGGGGSGAAGSGHHSLHLHPMGSASPAAGSAGQTTAIGIEARLRVAEEAVEDIRRAMTVYKIAAATAESEVTQLRKACAALERRAEEASNVAPAGTIAALHSQIDDALVPIKRTVDRMDRETERRVEDLARRIEVAEREAAAAKQAARSASARAEDSLGSSSHTDRVEALERELVALKSHHKTSLHRLEQLESSELLLRPPALQQQQHQQLINQHQPAALTARIDDLERRLGEVSAQTETVRRSVASVDTLARALKDTRDGDCAAVLQGAVEKARAALQPTEAAVRGLEGSTQALEQASAEQARALAKTERSLAAAERLLQEHVEALERLPAAEATLEKLSRRVEAVASASIVERAVDRAVASDPGVSEEEIWKAISEIRRTIKAREEALVKDHAAARAVADAAEARIDGLAATVEGLDTRVRQHQRQTLERLDEVDEDIERISLAASSSKPAASSAGDDSGTGVPAGALADVMRQIEALKAEKRSGGGGGRVDSGALADLEREIETLKGDPRLPEALELLEEVKTWCLSLQNAIGEDLSMYVRNLAVEEIRRDQEERGEDVGEAPRQQQKQEPETSPSLGKARKVTFDTRQPAAAAAVASSEEHDSSREEQQAAAMSLLDSRLGEVEAGLKEARTQHQTLEEIVQFVGQRMSSIASDCSTLATDTASVADKVNRIDVRVDELTMDNATLAEAVDAVSKLAKGGGKHKGGGHHGDQVGEEFKTKIEALVAGIGGDVETFEAEMAARLEKFISTNTALVEQLRFFVEEAFGNATSEGQGLRDALVYLQNRINIHDAILAQPQPAAAAAAAAAAARENNFKRAAVNQSVVSLAVSDESSPPPVSLRNQHQHQQQQRQQPGLPLHRSPSGLRYSSGALAEQLSDDEDSNSWDEPERRRVSKVSPNIISSGSAARPPSITVSPSSPQRSNLAAAPAPAPVTAAAAPATAVPTHLAAAAAQETSLENSWDMSDSKQKFKSSGLSRGAAAAAGDYEEEVYEEDADHVIEEELAGGSAGRSNASSSRSPQKSVAPQYLPRPATAPSRADQSGGSFNNSWDASETQLNLEGIDEEDAPGSDDEDNDNGGRNKSNKNQAPPKTLQQQSSSQQQQQQQQQQQRRSVEKSESVEVSDAIDDWDDEALDFLVK